MNATARDTSPKPGGWERHQPRFSTAKQVIARSQRSTRSTRSRLHACTTIAAISLALLAGGCTTTVDVHDVCETFVRSDTPPISPTLRHRDDGKLELLVSVTDAAEAQAVVAAARKEPIDVMMYPSEMFVHVLRLEGNQLVVKVNSPEHATSAIDALCIAPGDP